MVVTNVTLSLSAAFFVSRLLKRTQTAIFLASFRSTVSVIVETECFSLVVSSTE